MTRKHHVAIAATIAGVFYPFLAGLFWEVMVEPLPPLSAVKTGAALSIFLCGCAVVAGVIALWFNAINGEVKKS